MSRPPLLLIHGFTDTAATWTPLVPHLQDEFELLTPTLLGHHGGPPLPPDMTDPLGALADGLERVLDEAGIAGPLPVVGNSLGGWLAFGLGARGRASSVLALSPAFGWPEEQQPVRTRRQFARAQRMAPVGARLGTRAVSRAGQRKLAFWELIAHPERVPPSTAAQLIRGAADCPIYRPLTAQLQDAGYRDSWQEVPVPTVIAWGTHDLTIPLSRSSAWFRDALPDARWVDLPECGHLPHHDDPELVAALVREVAGG